MKNKINSLNHQAGVVLAVSLIFLVLLTLIGLTGTQVTSLEEKMSSNSKDQNIAFQAAEAALRGGEANVGIIVTLIAFDGTDGLYGEDDHEPDFSYSGNWADDVSREFVSEIAQVDTEPRYYIKYLTTAEPDGNISPEVFLHGEGTAGDAVSYFTVTARGTGGQDNTKVYLRSYYAARF